MNTPCPDIQLELTGFAAGDLDPDAADRVARHVAGCADCRAELARELRLREALAGLPRAGGPAAAWAAGPAAPRRRARAAGRACPWPPARAGGRRAPGGAAGGPARPAARPPRRRRHRDLVFTADQVATARRDAAWTLVLAARILERSEKSAVSDVFGQRLPRAVAESLRDDPSTPEGGQG